MLDKLKRLFIRRKAVETLPSGIKEVILDDIHLCNTCPMKGKCELPNGCVSLNNLQEKRHQTIMKIRGISTQPTKPVDMFYLKGLSWSSEYKNINYRYKVTFVEGDKAKVRVIQSKHGNPNYSSLKWRVLKDEIIDVRIPKITSRDGKCVADIQAFKRAVIEEMSTWRPSN